MIFPACINLPASSHYKGMYPHGSPILWYIPYRTVVNFDFELEVPGYSAEVAKISYKLKLPHTTQEGTGFSSRAAEASGNTSSGSPCRSNGPNQGDTVSKSSQTRGCVATWHCCSSTTSRCLLSEFPWKAVYFIPLPHIRIRLDALALTISIYSNILRYCDQLNKFLYRLFPEHFLMRTTFLKSELFIFCCLCN